MTTLAVAIAAVAPGPAAAASGCNARGSKTLAQSEAARVYSLPGRRVYGCLFSTRTPRRLDGGSRDTGETRLVRLGGRYVAFVRGPADSGDTDEIRVVDMRRGKVRRVVRDPGGGDGLDVVTDLEVTTGASLAWIVSTESSDRTRTKEVQTMDGEGQRLRDADGASVFIDRHSLALSGRRVYWTKGDAAATYRLTA